MSAYWCTETLPLAVTGLIPVFLLPFFGIMSTTRVCLNFFNDTVMMITGGVMVALAVENSMLHRRLAINVLLRCGTTPRW